MDELGNVAKALTFYSEDRKSLIVDLYNRFIGLTVFAPQSAQPEIKAILEAEFAIQLVYFVEKVIKDRDIQPLGLSFSMWNKAANNREFRCGVTIGRDVQDKAIYLDITSDRHKDPVRFFLTMSEAYMINDQKPSRLIATEAGARSLVFALKTLARLQIERGFEKNNGDKQFKPNDQQVPVPPPIGDDVEF